MADFLFPQFEKDALYAVKEGYSLTSVFEMIRGVSITATSLYLSTTLTTGSIGSEINI